MKKLLFVLLLSPFAAQAGLGDAIGNAIGNTVGTAVNVADTAVEGTAATVDQAVYDLTDYDYGDENYYDSYGNRIDRPRWVRGEQRTYPVGRYGHRYR